MHISANCTCLHLIAHYLAAKKTKKPACIPYVSEYNDCNEYSTCSGCNQCRCDGNAQWVCYKRRSTCSENADEMAVFNDNADDSAVGKILNELAEQDRKDKGTRLETHRAPLPAKRKVTTEAPLLGFNDDEVMKEVQAILRGARSVGTDNDTHIPIQFHSAVDELNEDTFKNSNQSGIVVAQKVMPMQIRRSGVLVNSSDNPLQIEYNNPTIYNNHITDNKIESSHNVDKYDALVKEKMHDIINFTQNVKDKELSKIVVNELKNGSERIGDTKGPVTTNITFTPEKDTLTAMAFIAGNLLNKLWNLERDSDDSIEADQEKNQKIADLLDLFKEPLTYRQETFLKEALEQLSAAVSKNKDIKNVSLCQTMYEIKEGIMNPDQVKENDTAGKPEQVGKETAAGNALVKLNEILELLKKYEVVQKNMLDVKHLKAGLRNGQIPAIHVTKDEKSSLNLFGNILEKITNLLIPNKNSRVKNKIRNQNILSNSHNLGDDVKKAFNINLDGKKLTPNDKLILDYIKRIQSNHCSSFTLAEDETFHHQSDILLNLSEFFKIKSYSDLLKLVEPKSAVSSTTPTTTTTVNSPSYPILRTSSNDSPGETENNTLSVNDKLKIHLKAIVNDLIEIERKKGKDIKPGGIDIADALPCILNMLNKDKNQRKSNKEYSRATLLNKIKYVLEAIKKDTRERNLPQNRRNMQNVGPKPKSAVVWERVIKNLNDNFKPSRRSLKTVEPPSYDAIKKMMDQIESNSSNTYKMVALTKEVPVSGQLTLLKTLLLDTGDYANILGNLLRLNHEKKIPESQLHDAIEFVDTAAANFDLNAKVVNRLTDTKPERFKIMSDISPATERNTKMRSDSNYNSKSTREQTVSQVIKNRVYQYLRVKESEGAKSDISYNLGQRILSHLERGNDKLAMELYKILMESRQKQKSTSVSSSRPKAALRTSLGQATSPVHAESSTTQRNGVSDELFLKTVESAISNIEI